MKNILKEQWIFLKQLKNNPSTMGAAFPSSNSLARAMVQQIPKKCDGLIVELGAGTGSITKWLRKKFPPQQLLMVERSQELYAFIKNKFPDSLIVLGDAADLSTLIKLLFLKSDVAVIISSLPLRALPLEKVEQIETAIIEVLTDNGIFIQFTYDLRDNATAILPRLKHLYSKKVWLNLPPARIDVYSLKK